MRHNIELLAELVGVPKVERTRRVADNISLVGLSGFERKYPKQLSGGMKMRASLARSPVLAPSVLRFEPAFTELSGDVSHALRGAHT